MFDREVLKATGPGKVVISNGAPAGGVRAALANLDIDGDALEAEHKIFLDAQVVPIGLLISGAQVVLLSRAAPGLAIDGTARAVALGLVALSSIVVVVSVAFLRRRRWARATLAAILALGIVASLTRLMLPAPPIEPPPAEAPAEYLRLLRLISLADVVVPIAACLAFGWILWRLRSPGVRDQFR